MKAGEVVRFRDKRYHVGVCKTNTSIELIELEDTLKGLWVSRKDVHKEIQGPDQPATNTHPPS